MPAPALTFHLVTGVFYLELLTCHRLASWLAVRRFLKMLARLSPYRMKPKRVVSGGGGSAGFTEEPGFTVEGTMSHGSALTITRSSGTWATRAYGNSPWLYDIGSAQYHAGSVLDALSAVGDGELVPVTISGAPWDSYSQEAHRIRATTSRTAPNARTTKWLYSTTGAADMKCELFEPVWPSGWGTQNNQRIYLSYWIKNKFAYRSWGGDYIGKFVRFNDTNGLGVGTTQYTPDSISHATSTMFDAGPYPVDDTWQRNELYVDLDADAADGYHRYRYKRQVESTGTSHGPHEIRRDDNFLYTENLTNGNTPLEHTDWINVIISKAGFDGQGGAVHAGQEIDIANFYVDTEWERFEISDSSTWDIGPCAYGAPSTGTPREVQGRWSRDSDTVCTVYINQGQFASLSGKYLWYVSGLKTATLIGQFD